MKTIRQIDIYFTYNRPSTVSIHREGNDGEYDAERTYQATCSSWKRIDRAIQGWQGLVRPNRTAFMRPLEIR